MEIHKLIKAKEKGKLVIDSCLSIDQLEYAKIYVEQFYIKFNDLVSYSELIILINNKKEKLKEMKTLKNIMYAGLGLMYQADDKVKGQFNMLVDKGKKIDKDSNNFVKEYFKIIDVMKESMGKKITEEINLKIERMEDFLQTIKQ